MPDTKRSLQGRVAWVTGGATGMGFAAAKCLAGAGAAVAIGSLGEDSSATCRRPDRADRERVTFGPK